jgi:hypothetical protein
MAVIEKEIVSNVESTRLLNFLKESDPTMMCEFVSLLEGHEKAHTLRDLIVDMKSIAFLKFVASLNINRHYFNTNNAKRFRTELYFEPLNNYKPVLFISVKDSRNEDAMRARLFDEHKERLLSLLADRETEAVKS